MRKTKFPLTLLLSLCVCSLAPFASANEQRVSIGDFLLSKSPAIAPSVRLNYALGGEVDFDSAPGGFSYQRLELNAPLMAPYHLNDCHALTLGLAYKATWFDSDTLLNDMDLHDLRLKLSWMYRQPGSKWSWITVLEPGLATDGESVDMDDFSINGQVGVRYAKSPRFAWNAGFVFFHNNLETRVYPGVGFQWRPSDDVHLRLAGPNFRASWQPHEDWILHADVRHSGGTWNVRENGSDFNLRMRSFQAGIGVERRLSGKFWLGLWSGFTFANDVKIETASGKRLLREDADMGWFVRLGIRRAIW